MNAKDLRALICLVIIVSGVFFTLGGCEDKDDLKPYVDEKLNQMYEEIASCDELAKCMGFAEGKIQSDHKISMIQMNENSIYGRPAYSWRDPNAFRCVMYTEVKSGQQVFVAPGMKVLPLNEIRPTLAGCEARDCKTTKKKCED